MKDERNLNLKLKHQHTSEFVRAMDIDHSGQTAETRKHLAKLQQRLEAGEIEAVPRKRVREKMEGLEEVPDNVVPF